MLNPMAAFTAAEATLTKALSSVPDHARGHMLLGYVEILTRRAAQDIAECERALELDGNLANAHSMVGYGKIFVGRAEETEAHIGEALRLSPRDTLAYTWMGIAGIAKGRLGVWSRPLMEHPYRVIRRMRYGPSSAWERHDDRGDPSSDTA